MTVILPVSINSTDWTVHAGDSETVANWKRVWGAEGKPIRTFPVIGAGGNITGLRSLFTKANITAFAASAAAVVAELDFAGLNLDFEPSTFVHEPAMDGPNPSGTYTSAACPLWAGRSAPASGRSSHTSCCTQS